MLLPILAEAGLELWEIEIKPASSNGRVRVLVDRAGGDEPGKGVTIGELSSVAKQLNFLLDADDFIPFSYRLEVSSPGVERDLSRLEHFARYAGGRVRVVLRRATEDGHVVLQGELVDASDSAGVVVRCEDGVERRFSLDVLKRAQTLYDFGDSEPQRSAKSKNPK